MKPFIRLLLALSAFAATALLARAASATFITHPDGPGTVSRADVKNILLGNKTKWDSGTLLKLAVLTEGAAHESVIQEFTARSADQFEKYWKKQVFTGKGDAPSAFKSDADMIAFVAKTPGSFGYVSAAAAPAGVKAVKVE
jgi:ABC-type phosphate transport system substrate-binding protein